MAPRAHATGSSRHSQYRLRVLRHGSCSITPRTGRRDGGEDTKYDGENVAETLLGRSKRSRQQPLFFSRPPDRKSFYGFQNLPDLAVRHGKWKLLCDYDGSLPQLYDLSVDPGESKNLTDSQPEVARELVGKVVAWHRSIK